MLLPIRYQDLITRLAAILSTDVGSTNLQPEQSRTGTSSALINEQGVSGKVHPRHLGELQWPWLRCMKMIAFFLVWP